MATARVLIIPVVALLLVASGCGSTGTTGPEASKQSVSGGGGDNALSATDTADVLAALRTIDGRCGGVAADAAAAAGVPAAVQTLVSVTQQYPGRTYETGNSAAAEQMRHVAATTASELRRCGIADQAARLAGASATNGA